MTIGVRHLQVFAAVARTLNLTRAAGELHLSQPAVSRTLQELEQHLGAPLVVRSPRGVELTEEGRDALAQARAALAAVDAALLPLAQRRRGLLIGHAWAALGAHTAEVLQSWRAVRPDVPVELRRIDERLAGLDERRVDASIVRGVRAEPGVQLRHLCDERRMAALPAGHRLAGRAEVSLADLTEDTLIHNTVSGTTSLSLWEGQRGPRSVTPVRNTDDWAAAIAAESGVGVTTEATRVMYPHPGIAYVPLLDAPAVPVALAWRDPAPVGVQEFARFLEDALGSVASSQSSGSAASAL
ncbi:LysR family transcriptional regulator [Naasia aerilata]|uniref:LysR family transcriptional regulator n=1 Tax=Naasia aerilata TaxID=1162966 RepID=A0ABM8GDW0_9MICO|nr:LysR family transcriptional regulator [Naasia aerilata]BDZ46472.1 LysR family transcriptional regulator [Naasia aerilata]